MTPNTTPKLSMNPLTATLSMRLVVALYSVRRTVKLLSSSSPTLASIAKAASPFKQEPTPVLIELLVMWPWDALGDAREKERWTRGESSASTLSARRADDASLCVGRGIEMILWLT